MGDSTWLGVIELLLVLGGVLGFGFYELRKLDRLKREREAKKRAAAGEDGEPGG